jgi:hypothetical protein
MHSPTHSRCAVPGSARDFGLAWALGRISCMQTSDCCPQQRGASVTVSKQGSDSTQWDGICLSKLTPCVAFLAPQRLMNLERFGDEQGGNTAVRFALESGLLKQGSILEDNLMVGNKGFDPAGFATSQEKLDEYREAELKHGRLAMLAAVGWPVSEYLQPILAKQYGAPDLLAAGEKAPSLLNGGFDRINPLFFIGTLAFTAAVENFGLKGGFADREPGDLGFDPLNLYYGSTEDVKYSYRLKEVNNGRLAMVAITYYAFTEFFTGTNTLEESGKVFAPFITGQPAAL